jgi:hypothetical protein
MVSGVEGVRPAWWQALHGDDPYMPDVCSNGRFVGNRKEFTGLQLEEIIFNRLHNKAWCSKEADLYVGPARSSAVDRMRHWNMLKQKWLHQDCSGETRPDNLNTGDHLSWKRYRDFVRNGGDRAVHKEIERLYQDKKVKARAAGASCGACGALRSWQPAAAYAICQAYGAGAADAAAAATLPRLAFLTPHQPDNQRADGVFRSSCLRRHRRVRT